MTILAQIQEVATAMPWLDYGKGGFLCIILWRFEILIKEVRKQGHETRGLSVAIMMETASRDHAEPAMRKFALAEIAKKENESAAE